VSLQIGDQQAFAQWQAAQHQIDDDDEPIEQPTHALDAETVRQLVLLVLPPVSHHGKDARLVTAFKRFLIIASFIDEHLAAKGLDHIAGLLTRIGIRCTRASLSQIHCTLADACGIHRLGRSNEGRAAYSERAKRVWATRKSTPQTTNP
jgi:hypothetical protein